MLLKTLAPSETHSGARRWGDYRVGGTKNGRHMQGTSFCLAESAVRCGHSRTGQELLSERALLYKASYLSSSLFSAYILLLGVGVHAWLENGAMTLPQNSTLLSVYPSANPRRLRPK